MISPQFKTALMNCKTLKDIFSEANKYYDTEKEISATAKIVISQHIEKLFILTNTKQK
jgi:hypothetical protein